MYSLSGGGFEFAHSGVMPQFNPAEHWPDDTDDDEAIDPRSSPMTLPGCRINVSAR